MKAVAAGRSLWALREPMRPWALVAVMWVAYLLNYTDRQVVFSMFPVLKAELRFTDAQLGLTSGLFLWVYALCAPLGGYLGDRFDRRRLLVASLLLWSLATAVAGLSTQPWQMLAGRAMIGLTESLFMPVALAVTAAAHSAGSRSRAVALFDTAQLAGVVAGGWFGGVMAQRGVWRWAFFSLGAIGVGYSIIYSVSLQALAPQQARECVHRSFFAHFSSLLRAPVYLAMCAVFPAFTISLWVLYAWLPTFILEKFGLSISEAGFTATAFLQGGTLGGLLLGGVLADRIYARWRTVRLWLVIAGLSTAGVSMLWLSLVPSVFQGRIAISLFGIAGGIFIANISVVVFECADADGKASALGLLNLIGASLSGLATFLSGTWKQTAGLQAAFTICGVLCAGSGILLGLWVWAPLAKKRSSS
jgi:MFS family permease